MMPAAISVIIPCFNDASYVAESIESVRRQTFEDWECVVVDDGSTDGSAEVIGSAKGRDRRIRLVRHETNRGLPATRNTGLTNTSARLVAFLDSDDLLTKRSLQDRIQTLQDRDTREVAGSYAGVRFVGSDIKLDDLPTAYKTGPTEVMDLFTADGECPFPVHAALTKREVIDRAGGFDESLTSGTEDWDLWYRILRLGYVFLPAALTSAVYRQRAGAMTREASDSHVAAATQLIEAAQRPAIVNPNPGGPIPLDKPLGDYHAQIQIAERGIRFAAMAVLDGREAEGKAIIENLAITDWPVVLRHLDIDRCIKGAGWRILGRKTTMEAPDVELEPVKRFVLSVVNAKEQLSNNR